MIWQLYSDKVKIRLVKVTKHEIKLKYYRRRRRLTDSKKREWFQHGIGRAWGTWALRGQSVGEEGCTSRHCRWAARSWEGRSWWLWLGWKGSLGSTKLRRCHTWSQSRHRMLDRYWTTLCSVLPCSPRSLRCTSCHTHMLPLHFYISFRGSKLATI